LVYKRDWGFVFGYKVLFTVIPSRTCEKRKERQRDRLGNGG